MRLRAAAPIAVASAFSVCASLAPGAAHAQTSGPLPLQGVLWTPTLSFETDALPHVEGTRLPGAWNWNAGVALQILERPYVGRTMGAGGRTETTTIVGHQLWSNFLVQLGLAPCLSLALELPVLLSQNGDLSAFGQAGSASVGFGDIRGLLRWSTRKHPSPPPPGTAGPATRNPSEGFINEGPGLGVQLGVTAPTGDPRSLTGTGAWTVHPSVTGDLRLFGLIVGAQLGYRARLDQNWPSQGGECGATITGMGMSGMAGVSCIGNVPLRDAITWSVGLRVPEGLFAGVGAPYVEAYGAIDARRPGSPGSYPIEIGVGLQRVFGEVTLTLGAATGVTDVPGNPRVRGMLMAQWAPRFVDEDGDGLRDNTGEDQCVGLPEDRDGYQDTDGCPEDNDTDEVPDLEDRCPTVDEDMDGFDDEDGCPDPDNDQDGVLDADDQCRDVAMGPNPDEQRAGCPNEDSDGDGVRGEADQCPTEAQGAQPDPARAGCPAADRDHDGVPDASDVCPDQPAGAGATPEQQGCAEIDRDHDGVLDANDRCPESLETINGVRDDDGCVEAPAPAGARVRVRIAGVSATSPGTIELLESVRFTAADAVDRASEPLMAQLAIAVIASSRVPWRRWTVSVAPTPATVRGPLAVDAARAARRRDAVIAALRARGVPENAIRPGEALPASAAPVRNDRGIVLTPVGSAPSATSAPAPASAAPVPVVGEAVSETRPSTPPTEPASAPATGAVTTPAATPATAAPATARPAAARPAAARPANAPAAARPAAARPASAPAATPAAARPARPRPASPAR